MKGFFFFSFAINLQQMWTTFGENTGTTLAAVYKVDSDSKKLIMLQKDND